MQKSWKNRNFDVTQIPDRSGFDGQVVNQQYLENQADLELLAGIFEISVKISVEMGF